MNSQLSDGFEVEIRCPDFQLTPALRQYAMHHLAARLAKHARRIRSVIVRFEDRRGARGAADKVCRVEVLIPHSAPLIVEEVEPDLRAAIDIAADRIEKAVQRDLDRMRPLRRHRARELVREQKLQH